MENLREKDGLYGDRIKKEISYKGKLIKLIEDKSKDWNGLGIYYFDTRQDNQKLRTVLAHHLNGQIAERGVYRKLKSSDDWRGLGGYGHGIHHGEYKTYDESGNLILKTEFKDGKRIKNIETFYENGNPKLDIGLVKYSISKNRIFQHKIEVKEYDLEGNLKEFVIRYDKTRYDEWILNSGLENHGTRNADSLLQHLKFNNDREVHSVGELYLEYSPF